MTHQQVFRITISGDDVEVESQYPGADGVWQPIANYWFEAEMLRRASEVVYADIGADAFPRAEGAGEETT